MGVFNASARHLLNDLGRRISLNSGEDRETSFLYQRISILVHGASMLSFYMTACRPLTARKRISIVPTFLISHLIFELPRDYIYRGLKKIKY